VLQSPKHVLVSSSEREVLHFQLHAMKRFLAFGSQRQLRQSSDAKRNSTEQLNLKTFANND